MTAAPDESFDYFRDNEEAVANRDAKARAVAAAMYADETPVETAAGRSEVERRQLLKRLDMRSSNLDMLWDLAVRKLWQKYDYEVRHGIRTAMPAPEPEPPAESAPRGQWPRGWDTVVALGPIPDRPDARCGKCGDPAVIGLLDRFACAEHPPVGREWGAKLNFADRDDTTAYCAASRCYCGRCPHYRLAGAPSTPAAMNIVDARVIASGKRRASPEDYAAAVAMVAATKTAGRPPVTEGAATSLGSEQRVGAAARSQAIRQAREAAGASTAATRGAGGLP